MSEWNTTDVYPEWFNDPNRYTVRPADDPNVPQWHIVKKPKEDDRPEEYQGTVPKETRQTVLDFAGNAISGERDERYGNPEDNLGRIAKFWTVLFGVEVEPWQVALAMDLLKTSRLMYDPTHFDGWVDKAGYAAVGYEVTERRTNETNSSV